MSKSITKYNGLPFMDIIAREKIHSLENSMKDTNKYILICNDNPLIIKQSDITDLTDATITIDNLTCQFGILVVNENNSYTYTLNSIMTDVEVIVFKVNNVEQNVIIVPYKEMMYDENNPAISYVGDWYEDINDNYYNNSSHYTKGENNTISKISFIFAGTAVDIIGMLSKSIGNNIIMAQISEVNSDNTVENEYSYSIMNNNTIRSTNDIMYNNCICELELYDKLGFGKYKAVLTIPKGSTTYIDKIIVYNTIKNINDSIRSLYNQKESLSSVLRTDIPNKVYEPKGFYDPATKKYVDENSSNVADGFIMNDQDTGYKYLIQMKSGLLTSILLPESILVDTSPLEGVTFMEGDVIDIETLTIIGNYPDGISEPMPDIGNLSYEPVYLTTDVTQISFIYSVGKLKLTYDMPITIIAQSSN